MQLQITLDTATDDAAMVAAIVAVLAGRRERPETVPVYKPDGSKGPPLVTPGYVDADNYAWAEDAGEPAPVVTMLNPEGAPDVDSRGLPWDERIHASTKATNGDGSWRNKRGVDKDLLESVERELGGVLPDVPPPPAPLPEVPNAPVAEEPSIPAAPTPSVPVAPTDGAPSFKDAMAIVTTRQREGTLTQVQVAEAAQALGLTSVVDLAKPVNAEHIAAFIALLG